MMRKILIMLLAGFFVTATAQAATCEEQAAEKKLHGAAQASFIKKCEKDSVQKACEDKAAEKKLHGAAKNSFVKKCVTDGKAASAAERCEAQAAEKKLHGAAKNSFIKKCVETASN
ncbi:hypothetical protein LJC19_03755 [Oxalobacter sp. OttesenSCG-928-P03]|nr:hypothetical protein [Oxalobacter sp. OttesenSCG-928-P03]